MAKRCTRLNVAASLMMEHDKVDRSDAREEHPEQDHTPGVYLVLVRYVCQRESENQCHSHNGCALLDTADTHEEWARIG